MTVDEMLHRTPSYRLTEWMAYEQLFGPLGSTYADNQLATIDEQLQLGNRIAGAQAKSNPAPKPKHVKRPWEIHEDPKHRNYAPRKPVEDEEE